MKGTIVNTNTMLLSPEEFVKLYESNPESVQSSLIIPPEPGKSGFGKILVEFDSSFDLCGNFVKQLQKTSENFAK